jgi:hypothetical protein
VLIVGAAALARRQELLEPLAVGLLGLLVAMPRVVELQASPLVRIHRVRLRSLKFAVGWRLFVDGFTDGFMDGFMDRYMIWLMDRLVQEMSDQLGAFAVRGEDGGPPSGMPNSLGSTLSLISLACAQARLDVWFDADLSWAELEEQAAIVSTNDAAAGTNSVCATGRNCLAALAFCRTQCRSNRRA